MPRSKSPLLRLPGTPRWLAGLIVPVALALSPRAAAQEGLGGYGFGLSSGRGSLAVSLFARPSYVYASDDGSGDDQSTFSIDLAGVQVRAETARGVIGAQATGALHVDEFELLGTYLELRPGRHLALRLGNFKVPYDEQTTHEPFWLRTSRRSIDVRSLGYLYDLGIAMTGAFINDGLAFTVSVTNGEPPTLENLNVDFLYAARLAMSFGRMLDWSRLDLIIGLGANWTLEPWEPEPGRTVNRSVLGTTADVSLQSGRVGLTAAILHRMTDPGAEGPVVNSLGWHVEGGVFVVRDTIEVAASVASIYPDLEGSDEGRLETTAGLNVFGERGRIRFQGEYSYETSLEGEGGQPDIHRASLAIQAIY